ncbi:unnamed protein product [Diabrotica balteata]|uniref:Laminin EGF-like domain-containing protein n=1 Tax=Diabrotica balteata TaxID=107213 RepID=A0A9N9T1Z5_DIABA|nr:unnamed protein product [Diabrotica balteata]
MPGPQNVNFITYVPNVKMTHYAVGAMTDPEQELEFVSLESTKRLDNADNAKFVLLILIVKNNTVNKTAYDLIKFNSILGPFTNTTSMTCPVKHWYFRSCPQCQCNGHGSCDNNSSTCIKCNSRTTGSNCQQCIKGYWGSTLNGGQCKKCQCTLDANDCNKESGACNCLTKGTIGNNCDQCDRFNHFYPDSYKNNACYCPRYMVGFKVIDQRNEYHKYINQISTQNEPFYYITLNLVKI